MSLTAYFHGYSLYWFSKLLKLFSVLRRKPWVPMHTDAKWSLNGYSLLGNTYKWLSNAPMHMNTKQMDVKWSRNYRDYKILWWQSCVCPKYRQYFTYNAIKFNDKEPIFRIKKIIIINPWVLPSTATQWCWL